MDFYEVVEKRRSVRAYDRRAVEDEKLQRILEAARLAPSAGNRQEWRFVVVRDVEIRRQLMGVASNQPFVAQAPIVVACCAESDGHLMRCGQPSYPIDVAIAAAHIALAATAESLGTCWIGAFDENGARELLGIPESIRVVQLMALGYPADSPRPRRRKTTEEIVCYDRWSLGEPAL
jgi:nitroreductase